VGSRDKQTDQDTSAVEGKHEGRKEEESQLAQAPEMWAWGHRRGEVEAERTGVLEIENLAGTEK